MRGKSKSKKEEKGSVGELRNQLARALADYDNLRKRVEREREDFSKIASLNLISRLLPVFDMLEEAQEHLKDSGLAITIKEFEDVLLEEGLERIYAKKGMRFDEKNHEAVEVVDLTANRKGKAAEPGGEIIEELLSGWKFTDGPVVRASKVKVNKEK